MMPPADLERLKEKINDAILALPASAKVAIVGWCSTAFELAALPAFVAGAAKLEGIFAPLSVANARPLGELADCAPDIVVIAEDAGKEALLEAVAARVPASTRLLIGGYAHYNFRDEIFDRVCRQSTELNRLLKNYPDPVHPGPDLQADCVVFRDTEFGV
jgi:O-methyltransferase